MRRFLAAAVSLGLVVSMSGVVVGESAPPLPTRMVIDALIAPSGTTTLFGQLEGQFRVVPNGEIPGTLTLTAPSDSDVGHGLFMAKYVFFDAWRDESGSAAYGNWTFVQGQQCNYMRTGADTSCFDVDYGLVDFWDPARTDVVSVCTWDGGVRPAYGWEACEPALYPGVHVEWLDVVRGSLNVH